MTQAVFCIVPNPAQAQVIVDNLHSEGFASDSISVLIPDEASVPDLAHGNRTRAAAGAMGGVKADGVVEGTLRSLGSVAIVVIPGVGPFVVAGPIMSALSTAFVGTPVGRIARTLVVLGIPEFEAKLYDERIRGGSALVALHTEIADDAKCVREIFERAGTQFVFTLDDAPTRLDRDTARNWGASGVSRGIT